MNLVKTLGYVYIITNKNNTTFYTGVTSMLIRRIEEHKHKVYSRSFSARYNLNKLVYYRLVGTIGEAIQEEKRIKAGSRLKKIALIVDTNPDFHDLYDSLLEEG